MSTVSETAEGHEMPANEGVRDSRATPDLGAPKAEKERGGAGLSSIGTGAPALPARSCASTNKRGEPCRAVVVGKDGFCSMHSPTRAVSAAELGRRGGIVSGEVRREQAKTVRDRLREKVEEQFDLVWAAFESGLLSDDERARVSAAVAALDQAYGRPAVSIEGGDQPVAIILGSLLERAREEAA